MPSPASPELQMKALANGHRSGASFARSTKEVPLKINSASDDYSTSGEEPIKAEGVEKTRAVMVSQSKDIPRWYAGVCADVSVNAKAAAMAKTVHTNSPKKAANAVLHKAEGIWPNGSVGVL